MRDQDRAPLSLCERPRPSASASSPSKAPSTAARSRPSPPAARRNTSKASARRSRASTRCRSATRKALEAAIGPETAAILIEPIQGEGGIRSVPHEELRYLRALCDEHGLLLIFDEIQSGMGRTGRFFAHEWAGVTPDIAALAKGLGARLSGRRLPCDARSVRRHDRRHARHHLRRQPARHGGRRRRARHRPRRGFPRARAPHRADPQAEARRRSPTRIRTSSRKFAARA